MKAFIIALLLSQTVIANDYYKADCHIKIKSRNHPDIIGLHILREQVNIEIYNEFKWCVFIDSYEDVVFYECGDYKMTFRDHMREMIYGGRAYSCFFEREGE